MEKATRAKFNIKFNQKVITLQHLAEKTKQNKTKTQTRTTEFVKNIMITT